MGRGGGGAPGRENGGCGGRRMSLVMMAGLTALVMVRGTYPSVSARGCEGAPSRAPSPAPSLALRPASLCLPAASSSALVRFLDRSDHEDCSRMRTLARRAA